MIGLGDNSLNAAELFVQCLENEGVTRVFGVPGEENAELMMALDASSIEFVLTRHEQGAAFMAEVHGRLTGEPGVCLDHTRTRCCEPRYRRGKRQHGPCSAYCNNRPGGNRTLA